MRVPGHPRFGADGVIVLFSSSDETDVDWCGAGADAFLQKPFELKALPQLLERLRRERVRISGAGASH